MKLRVASRIQRALDSGRPVVALESTVITHGLPRPENLQLAADLEAEIQTAGAEPATIGVLGGELVIGLDADELHTLDDGPSDKATYWNLAALMTRGQHAGTTVATTLLAAEMAGIEVFATGGIGGVHHTPFDESADLRALSRHAVITVCAGPKSILDVKSTLERLETLGVPVIGYRSDQVAGFHTPRTEHAAAARADTPAEIAATYRTHRQLRLPGGVLVTNPVSEGLGAEELTELIDRAHRDAAAEDLRGKDTTPFMLARLAELSGGKTVQVNTRLLRENARLAAEVARTLAEATQHSGAI